MYINIGTVQLYTKVNNESKGQQLYCCVTFHSPSRIFNIEQKLISKNDY